MKAISIAIFALAAIAGAVAADTPTVAIKLDQVGYPVGATKVAVVSAPATTFVVKCVGKDKPVFEGRLTPAVQDADTGDTVSLADFTPVRDRGTYYIEVPGVGRSWPFRIGDDVYDRTYYLAMRAFYGQRCGTAVDLGPRFEGYSHPACHLRGAFDPSSGRTGAHNVHFGWHDAGDYGRYIPSSAIATATLLWAWEMYAPKLEHVRLDIPESGRAAPDFLSEVRWDLEWMLSMQDGDGGVWHKETTAEFAKFVLPQDDPAPSLVIGTGKAPFKSTCATADLAAVAAIAARAYASVDEAFAKRNLQAARKAWTWAEQNPNVTFANPTGIATGEYGDRRCSDERLWAAAEIWRTTGEAAYLRYFVENYTGFLDALDAPAAENWANLANMALWSYALADRNDNNQAATTAIRQKILEAAQVIATRTRSSAYRVSMTAADYVWGSNGVAANYSMQLLIANRLPPHAEFSEAALDNLHYLLGRNTFSLSWVTQTGANPFKHPHHRPSIADPARAPWPGLLAGGPNAARQDSVLKRLPELPRAKVYVDDQESYSSNEVAINWQAMLVFVLAAQLK